MRKNRNICEVFMIPLTVMLIAGTGFAGDLDPTAAPAPTMKTLDEVQPRIAIDSGTYTITSSGSYYLTGDLTGNGIDVNADHVTIDFMGYSLTYTGQYTHHGVYMFDRKNVEIKNGTIKGYAHGIRENGNNASGHRIVNMRIYDSSSNGIALTGSGHLVKDCTVGSVSSGHGIYANDSGVIGNHISNVVSTGDNFGIFLEDGVAADNVVMNNKGGIWATRSVVRSNAVSFSTGEGIRCFMGCTILDNAVTNNGTGFLVQKSLCSRNMGLGNSGNDQCSTSSTQYNLVIDNHTY